MKLTSPTQVKNWCIENGFHPNKTLGQNFLVDLNILNIITDAAGISEGDRVLEIGPGLGVLTEALLHRGARVTAVEKDGRLAGRLDAALGSPDELQVIEADALALDLDGFLAVGFDACVSNLPYSVGTRILLELALHPAAPRCFVVLVQSEVAERFRAYPGAEARGQSGVWLQLDYEVTLIREVKAACFWPKPEVGSAIVRLDRRSCGLSKSERRWFFDLTRHAFMHRRKQLGAVLRKAPEPLSCSEERLAQIFTESGIDPHDRPERLSGEQWQALSRAFDRVFNADD
ncbi:MAG: 16S rRNA (adenine(1518)-N(6)/adenine(1519)-N(6))-dimethyltransferase RsmA [Kiritimatiellae bacterium]|nr:16S rRNA (adenine(1518)-N(6)/adenine(1519)-N(6))-dimethyltransferase RsmA [Kiritimatiellia bacterium]